MPASGEATSIPIAIGESLYSVSHFREYLAAGACGVVQVDVARIGGITPWLKTAHLAEAFNVRVAPHFLMELHVSLAAAIPNAMYVEHIPQLRALTRTGIEIVDGHALAPTAPGLFVGVLTVGTFGFGPFYGEPSRQLVDRPWRRDTRWRDLARRVRTDWLSRQLGAVGCGVGGAEHHLDHPLVLVRLAMQLPQAEHAGLEVDGLRQVPGRDPDVVDGRDQSRELLILLHGSTLPDPAPLAPVVRWAARRQVRPASARGGVEEE